jgi:TM2 domain-containing membrane protein YozV
MSKFNSFFIFPFLLIAHSLIASASESTISNNLPKDSTQLTNDSIKVETSLAASDSTILKKVSSNKSTRNKKIISALCAFPFPLGFVGAHRVMLGTKPWVPVVYVATFGGCFGLLPLIDFCVIVFSKDIEQYENNPNIFMWVK